MGLVSDLKAVSLVHQEPLSLGRVGHLLGVLGHQRVEVGVVFLRDHAYTSRGTP